MISFMGRSYCSKPCVNFDCDRNFSPALKVEADAWWATWNLPDKPCPVAYTDTFAKMCGDLYQPPTEGLDSSPTHDKVQP